MKFILLAGIAIGLASCTTLPPPPEMSDSLDNFVAANPDLVLLMTVVETKYAKTIASLPNPDAKRMQAIRDSWWRYLAEFCPTEGAEDSEETTNCLKVEFQRWGAELNNPTRWSTTWIDPSQECTLHEDMPIVRPMPERWKQDKSRLNVMTGNFLWDGSRTIAIEKIEGIPFAEERLVIGPVDVDQFSDADDWIAQQPNVRRFARSDKFGSEIDLVRNSISFKAFYFVRPRKGVFLPASEVMLKPNNGRLVAVCAVSEPLLSGDLK